MEKQVFPIPTLPHSSLCTVVPCWWVVVVGWFHHTLGDLLESSSDVSSHVCTNDLTSHPMDPPLLTLQQQQQKNCTTIFVVFLSPCFLHIHFFQQQLEKNFFLLLGVKTFFFLAFVNLHFWMLLRLGELSTYFIVLRDVFCGSYCLLHLYTHDTWVSLSY
jgi:hypothetical protein